MQAPKRKLRLRALTMAVMALAGLVMVAGPGFAASDGGRTLRIMVDKAQVIPLSGQATIVLVANPAIADVVVERDHLLFILGKRAGETRLFVFGADGRPLLERDLIVVPQEDHAVTVFRDTLTTNYSCDERCVAINTLAGPAAPAGAAPAAPAAPPAAPPVAPAVSPGAGLTAAR